MEYVRGRTLREVLDDRRRLDPAESLAMLEQMLAALAVAHRAGLVHRDVKPENVLVAAPPNGSGDLVDAVVKVADFGLAHAVEAQRRRQTGGQLLATAAYVAPELVTDGRADPRTDVYSAGIVLFEMLTGRVPFDGDRPVDVAWQHVDQDVPPPSRVVPGLPPLLDDLVLRATRRDPGGRPTDAGACSPRSRPPATTSGALAGTDRGRWPTRPWSCRRSCPSQRPGTRGPSWARPCPAGRRPRRGAGARPPRRPLAGRRRARLAAAPVGLALPATSDCAPPGAGRRTLIAAVVVVGLLLVARRLVARLRPLHRGARAGRPHQGQRGRPRPPGLASRSSYGGRHLRRDGPDGHGAWRSSPAPGGRIVQRRHDHAAPLAGPGALHVPDVAGQGVDFARPS